MTGLYKCLSTRPGKTLHYIDILSRQDRRFKSLLKVSYQTLWSEFTWNLLYHEIMHFFLTWLVNLNTLQNFLLVFPLILGFQKQWHCRRRLLLRPSLTFHGDLSEDCINWWSFNTKFRYVRVARFNKNSCGKNMKSKWT